MIITEIYQMTFDHHTGIHESVVHVEPTNPDEIEEIGVTLLGGNEEHVINIPYNNLGVILPSDTIYYLHSSDRAKHLFELFEEVIDNYDHDINYHRDEIKECYDKINELKQYLKENL